MKKIFYIAAFTLALSPVFVFADSAVPTGGSEFLTTPAAETPPSYVLLTPLPCVGATNGTTCTSANGTSQITSISIQNYLIYLFKLLIALAVFLAVIMIIFGGFKYITTEAVTGKGDAKTTIQHAAEGLLLALASYLILYTINPNLVNISKVAVPKLNVSTSQATQNSVSDLYTQQYQTGSAQVNSAINTNAAAYSTEQSAQQDMSNLSTQLYTNACTDSNGNDISNGDPDCTALENQYQNDQNIVTTAAAQQNTQQAIGTMANAENALNVPVDTHFSSLIPFNGGTDAVEGDTNITDAQTAIQTVNNTFNQAWSTIPNGDVSDKQALTNQMTYDDASVVNTYNTNVALANLTTDKYSAVGTAPADQQADIAAANSLIQTLKTNSIPNQTNSNGLITGPIGTLSPTSTLGQQYTTDNQAKITALQNAIKAAGGTPVQ